MAPAATAAMSEYERKRQETIAKNKALFQDLNLVGAAQKVAPARKIATTKSSTAKRTTRKSEPARGKENLEPARKSLRLQKITPDNVEAKRQIEEDLSRRVEEERAKKRRRTGDLDVSELLTSGSSWDGTGNFLRGVAPARPNVRTFDPAKAKETTDKDFKKTMEKMSSLTLWEDIEPTSIKLTPERVYAMTFHPTTDKALVFAGDKLGSLGIFDSAESKYVKSEDDDEDDMNLSITTLKLHTRTISALQFRASDPKSLYSASYDSTIRRFDLEKGVAMEVFAPYDDLAEEGISNLQLVESEPHIVYFTTLDGRFGIHDMRTGAKDQAGTTFYALSEKKIGGFAIHPSQPHLLATASLDRTMKLWDLRKILGKGSSRHPHLIGEHESRLSVSSASFNHMGQVATASYDDTVKIYDFRKCTTMSEGATLSEDEMKPTVAIRHNNQTGRWVTILKAHWQQTPQDGVQKFCIGSMDRFIDIYDARGRQLAQLGGDTVTAVPAVAQIHPTNNWVAGATASGKLCLYM